MKYLKLFIVLISLASLVIGSESIWVSYPSSILSDPNVGHVHAEDGQKWTCGMHPMIITDEPGLCPICNMDLTPLKPEASSAGSASPTAERRVKYWVAPMDPTYISDQPGKSPMGMDLVPVYEGDATGGSVIKIDPVTIQNMGLRTTQSVRHNLSRTVRTVGLVDYQEPQQFDVTTKIDGWVEKLYVNEVGQQVRKGEVLLAIYSPELVTAQEEYLLALKNLDSVRQSPFPSIVSGAERLVEASRKRLSYWDVSSAQINRLEKTRSVRRTLKLLAPYDGIVTSKQVFQGSFIKSGTKLMQIADIQKVWIYADIYEYELPWVKEGLRAEIEFPYANKVRQGVVSRVYPFMEAKTRTVKARIELDNPGLELKPDMYLNVTIFGEPIKGALVVPSEAVLRTGSQETVFVALDGGRFEPRAVKTGLHDDKGHVQILSGLFGGERVVTSAQFMLDSESKLREAIRKMMQPENPPVTAQPQSSGDDLEGLFDESKGRSEDLESLFE